MRYIYLTSTFKCDEMGVEYSSTEVQISNWETLLADPYYMVHSHFDLHSHITFFDYTIPNNFSTLGSKIS